MDVERIVFRLIADASSYFNVLDTAQSRLLFFASFVTQHMATAALKMAAEYEQAAIAFEVMTGSAREAREVLGDLSRLALETPFSFSEVLKSARQVKAFGFDVADITTVVSRLGDVAAGTGTDINRIILAFGQVRTTGRLMGQELRQFSNAGVPILDYLSRVTGKAVSAIPQLVRQGRISFGDVARAFNMMTDEGGLFADMMGRVSRETLGGRWQNFVESLGLATRNWGMMVVEVFKFKELLGEAAAYFQGSAQEDAIALWRSRFEEVNAVLALIGRTGRESWVAVKSAVSSAWDAAVRFYETHETGVRTVLAVVVAWYGVRAAIWAIITILRTMLMVLAAIRVAVLAVHATLAAIVGLTALIRMWTVMAASVGAVVTIVSTLVSMIGLLLSPVGLLVAAFAALMYAVLRDGELVNQAFDDMGAAVGRLIELVRLLLPDFQAAWAGIVDAVKGGDMGLAFDIAIAGIKLAWKGLMYWMESEWTSFSARFGNKITDKLQDAVMGMFESVDQFLAEHVGRNPGEVARLRRVAAEQQAERNAVRARRDARLEAPTSAEAIANYMRGLPEYRRMMDLTDQGRVVGLLGKEIRDFFKRLEEGPRIDNDQGRPAGNLQLSPAVQAALGGPAAFGVTDRYQEMLADLRTMNVLLETWVEKMRTGQPDLFLGNRVPTQADLDRQAGRIRTAYEELNKYTAAIQGNGEAARQARRALPTPLEVSAGARKAAQELERIFEEGGTSPLDHFLNRMQHINEAFRGPLPIEVAGVLGVPAVVGNRGFGGLINKAMADFGLMRAYTEFQRTLPNEQDRRPGAAMAGSREAQEIINRAQGQTLTVQEQIRAEIATGNYIAQQQAAHTAEVVTVLRGMAAQNGGKILGVRVDGGGRDE